LPFCKGVFTAGLFAFCFAGFAAPILLAAVGFRFTFPAIVPDSLAGAALVD
jgi:hypothetical protein